MTAYNNPARFGHCLVWRQHSYTIPQETSGGIPGAFEHTGYAYSNMTTNFGDDIDHEGHHNSDGRDDGNSTGTELVDCEAYRHAQGWSDGFLGAKAMCSCGRHNDPGRGPVLQLNHPQKGEFITLAYFGFSGAADASACGGSEMSMAPVFQ